MKNPITSSITNLLMYSAIWLIILAIHVTTLYILYDLTLLYAFIDGLIFNALFAIVGIALWYPVLYNDINKHSISSLIVNHLSIMSIALVFWIGICIFILKIIFPATDSYIASLDTGVIWRVFTGTFFYFSIIMVYYLFIYAHNLREHIMQESRLREKINEAELEALKSQINPHFLFNSLNSISSLTLTNPDKAHEMIIKLSSFLRYSLAHDPNNLIALQQEIENMDAYIAVEKIRFGDKLIFEKNIAAPCCEHKVPFLILQPLIENAIKHGVYESMEPVTIKVSCTEIDEDKIQIIVENNFDPQAVPRKGTGTGLKNIKERLKIIYRLDDLLTMEKTENYFKVILVLPNKPAYKNTTTQ